MRMNTKKWKLNSAMEEWRNVLEEEMEKRKEKMKRVVEVAEEESMKKTGKNSLQPGRVKNPKKLTETLRLVPVLEVRSIILPCHIEMNSGKKLNQKFLVSSESAAPPHGSVLQREDGFETSRSKATTGPQFKGRQVEISFEKLSTTSLELCLRPGHEKYLSSSTTLLDFRHPRTKDTPRTATRSATMGKILALVEVEVKTLSQCN